MEKWNQFMIHLNAFEFILFPSNFHSVVDFIPGSDDGIKIVNQAKSTFNTLHKHNHINKCVNQYWKQKLIDNNKILTMQTNTMTCNVYVYVREFIL